MKAILGAHGYKVHETYSPPWTQVDVPKSFLELVCPMAEKNIDCPMAEKNIELVKGKLTSVIARQVGLEISHRPQRSSWCHQLLGNGCLASSVSVPGMSKHQIYF